MRTRIIGVLTAMVIVSAPAAYAQSASSAGVTQENGRLSQTEFKILTDIRVGVIKIALQLTPEQQKLWPAVEDAIRARAEARYRRVATLRERAAQGRDIDPVQLYRERADALMERAAGLKKLADAWQPLYQSLSPDQKMRLGLVTARALEGLRGALEDRRMEMYEEDDSDF